MSFDLTNLGLVGISTRELSGSLSKKADCLFEYSDSENVSTVQSSASVHRGLFMRDSTYQSQSPM